MTYFIIITPDHIPDEWFMCYTYVLFVSYHTVSLNFVLIVDRTDDERSDVSRNGRLHNKNSCVLVRLWKVFILTMMARNVAETIDIVTCHFLGFSVSYFAHTHWMTYLLQNLIRNEAYGRLNEHQAFYRLFEEKYGIAFVRRSTVGVGVSFFIFLGFFLDIMVFSFSCHKFFIFCWFLILLFFGFFFIFLVLKYLLEYEMWKVGSLP